MRAETLEYLSSVLETLSRLSRDLRNFQFIADLMKNEYLLKFKWLLNS
jgi:hypothetical protein